MTERRSRGQKLAPTLCYTCAIPASYLRNSTENANAWSAAWLTLWPSPKLHVLLYSAKFISTLGVCIPLLIAYFGSDGVSSGRRVIDESLTY
ncbi:hypothetical protein EV356DRAFT_507146 [Viridothelium virens]|uniref:Uncharacterized protein n=1 Tax=Viridothelium virens TaxID=1048519 RepID=A0A6A6H034_VIRVR|nr:hypothetical protein EV356DRAFT_507146 [Viridothelium virens]